MPAAEPSDSPDPAVFEGAGATAYLHALHDASPDGFMLFRAVRTDPADWLSPIVDFEWRYVNPAAGRLLGRTPASLVGRRMLDEMPGNRVDGPFDAYVGVVTTGAAWQREFSYQQDGVDAAFRAVAVRVDDGFAVTFSDVTSAVRTEATLRATAARLRLLADAGRALGSTLERQAACAVIADLLVPRVADVCAVDLTDPDGRTVRVATTATDPALLAALPAPADVSAPPVALTRRDDPPDPTPNQPPSFGSFVAVPILERGRPIGSLTAAISATASSQAAEDTATLLEELARRLAVTLERIRLLTSSETARRDAENANRAKSQFLATMSHELRTPLNAILGYTDLLDAGIGGPLADAQQRYVDRVRASGRHLLGLIDDVLDFAKLEAGMLVVTCEPAALADACVAADALVRPQSRARLVHLDIAEPPPTIRYLGDEERVRQVLVNLLTNAIKFTAPNGMVSLEWSVDDTTPAAPTPHTARGMGPDDAHSALVAPRPAGPMPPHGWLRVQVRDSGIGIPANSLDRIFEPFVQIDASRTRTAEGTGLGLAISRQFALRMHGDLTVASEPGRGSVFALWLPLAALDSATLATRTRTHLELGRLVITHIGEIVARTTARLRASPLVPKGASTPQTDLENHLGTFLADFAQQFTILDEEAADTVPLVRDGSELQRMLVRKHGRQRHRLGWPEDALVVEFDVLADEITRVVRADSTLIGGELDDVLALMAALLDEALRMSVAGYHDRG